MLRHAALREGEGGIYAFFFECDACSNSPIKGFDNTLAFLRRYRKFVKQLGSELALPQVILGRQGWSFAFHLRFAGRRCFAVGHGFS